MAPVLGMRCSVGKPAPASSSCSARISAAMARMRGSFGLISPGLPSIARSLDRHPAAVDIIGGAGDIAGALRQKPYHHLGDFIGLAETAGGNAGKDPLAVALHRASRHAGF